MIAIDLEKALGAAGGEMQLSLQLEIEQGTLVTLYGESGVGKTSTLRMLAGLMQPDTGRIVVGDRVWFDSGRKQNLRPQERHIGYVFQDYALFPHMTVRENLEFAARKGADPQIVSDLIEMVALGELQHRKPDTLSGGQKQRVALARALVQKPGILLLDEPLSALDSKIRAKLQDDILRAHREFGLTTLLISHDLGEIHKLSDRVIMLERGRIVQDGGPEDLFTRGRISGKFRFSGEVLRIEPAGVVCIVTVLIQNQVVKIIAQESEISNLQVGDAVLVASKAFNPVIYKLDS